MTGCDEIVTVMDFASTKKTNTIATKRTNTIATNVTTTASINWQLLLFSIIMQNKKVQYKM